MMKIRINLASRQKGSTIVPYIAIFSVALAIILTWYNISSYIHYCSYISKMTARVAVLENRLPKGYKQSLLGNSEAEELKKDVEFINSFIEKKDIGWTGILSAIEEDLPQNVYLVQVWPDAKSQRIEISGVARGLDEALFTVEKLSQGGFNNVYLKGHSERKEDGRILFHLSAIYRGAK